MGGPQLVSDVVTTERPRDADALGGGETEVEPGDRLALTFGRLVDQQGRSFFVGYRVVHSRNPSGNPIFHTLELRHPAAQRDVGLVTIGVKDDCAFCGAELLSWVVARAEEVLHRLLGYDTAQTKRRSLGTDPGARWVARALVVSEQTLALAWRILAGHLRGQILIAVAGADPPNREHSETLRGEFPQTALLVPRCDAFGVEAPGHAGWSWLVAEFALVVSERLPCG